MDVGRHPKGLELGSVDACRIKNDARSRNGRNDKDCRNSSARALNVRLQSQAAVMTRLAERLQELARRVDRNVPSHRDPEAFHQEKSEIAEQLRRAAKEAEKS